MSTAYVYVLPLSGSEDWLKIGRSRDPLRRAQQFSRRYYDVFDLGRSFLVEFDRVRDAAAIERSLLLGMKVHQSMQPLLVQASAGGKTEWLRGAHAGVHESVRALSSAGHRVHAPADTWFRAALQARLGDLHPWTSSVWRACQLDPYSGIDVTLPEHIDSLVRDHLDGFGALGLDVVEALPLSVRCWYRPESVDAACL